MKKFLIRLLIFSLIISIVNIFFYFIVNEYYYKDYGSFDAGYSSYLIADSHGAALSEFTLKHKIYNFSDTTDSYHDMLRKVKFLLRKTRVRTIYLTVDKTTLSPYRDELNNLDRSNRFMSLSDYSSFYRYLKEKIIVKYFVVFNPKGRDVIKVYLESKLSSKRPGVKSWSGMTPEEKRSESLKRLDLQFGYDNASGALKEALKDIIKICSENNIELIGIKYPLSSVYLDIIGDRDFGADIIFREHDLKVLDFTRVFIDNDEYFADQDHLNREGGRAFVNLLIKAIDKGTAEKN